MLMPETHQVIRALYDYEAQSTQELSFSRGDFFHVIGRENDPDWYEACNPALPDARGLVPVAFFQALGRTERDSAQSDTSQPRTVPTTKNPDHDSGYAETSTPSAGAMPTPAMSQRNSKSGGKSGAMVYGIVMYDFQAERADELEAKAGEAIIVIAQSNPEWFVAKPIGRLGGPGLIPVSFVEIRDMATNTPVPNPEDSIRRAGIPKVEEWKKMAAEYKNSSITLGKFEAGGAPQQSMEQGMARMSLQQGAGGRTSQVNGANYVSFMSSIFLAQVLTCHFSPLATTHRETPRARARFSKTHMRPDPTQSYLPRLMRAYLVTVLLRTSTGLSLRLRLKMDDTGSYRDTTRTFTTSKSLSSQNSLLKPATQAHRNERCRICLVPLITLPTLSRKGGFIIWTRT